MRNIILATLAVLLIPGHATAEPATTEGLACFEDLSAPEYPSAALHSHVDGSVWTTTHVSPQGAIEKIDTEVVSAWGEGPKLLTPPVEKAIDSAKLKSECAGKTVSVVFRYQLHGEATDNPQVKTHREEPNIIWIESQPASVNATSAAARAPGKSQR